MSQFCSSCGSELTPGARFCASCGATATNVCINCGTDLPSGAAFCPACGSSQEVADVATTGSEERRVISALFADLAGFTAHTERSDPEEVRARLSLYHKRVREDVERHGGTVEKLMGDGVFAVFGVPAIHEDDAERAVRAALRIQESVGDLNSADASLDLSVRIGVTTGEAIVQLEAGGEDERIIGDVVNTASRLEGVAPRGGVVIDERTFHAVRNAVTCEPMDSVRVKGKAERIPIWRAVEAMGRYGVAVEEDETAALVGRQEELSLVVDAFDRAVARRSPQLVTVVGEPGVGKSRLVREFRRILDDRTDLVRWRQGRSLAYGEGVAFWALSEIVKSETGILESEPPASASDKLDRSVEALTSAAEDVDANWLRLRIGALAGTDRSEGIERAELFSAWLTYFELLATQRPLVLVVEDLHWADEALGDFLEHLVDWAQDAPVLVLCTARPEWFSRRPDWGGGKREAATVGLAPLTAEETADLVASLTQRTVMPAHAQQALLDRSGGNPLYLTEYVLLAEEQGWFDGEVDVEDLALPDSVQSIIGARLDLLEGDDKMLLQTAAVVGKVFWSGSLTYMLGIDAETAANGMRRLIRRELLRPVRRSSMQGQDEYTFSHVLVRDVAYAQLTRSDRARLHLEAARWLEAVSGDRAMDVAEMLAHHHTTALDLEPTEDKDRLVRVYRFLMLAGERNLGLDMQRSADFHHKAALIAPDPESRGKALLEYTRYAPTDREDALSAVSEAIEAFAEVGDELLQADAYEARSSLEWWGGDSDAAGASLEEAMALIDGLPASEVVASILTSMAGRFAIRGNEEEALEYAERAMAAAREIGDTRIYARALDKRGSALLQMGQMEGLDDVVEALRITSDLGNTREVMSGYNNVATPLVHFGQVEESLRTIDEAIDFGTARGDESAVEWSKMTKMEALLPMGRFAEMEAITAELETADRERGGTQVGTFTQSFIAALHHLRGETDRAWDLSRQVMKNARDIQDPQAMMPSFALGIATAHAAGDVESARSLALEFADYAPQHPVFISRDLPDAAPAMVELGLTDQVEQLADSALKMTDWMTASMGAVTALARQSEGNHREALALLKEAIAVGDDHHVAFNTARLRLSAARSAIALGEEAETTALLSRAEADAQEMGAASILSQIAALRTDTEPTAVGE